MSINKLIGLITDIIPDNCGECFAQEFARRNYPGSKFSTYFCRLPLQDYPKSTEIDIKYTRRRHPDCILELRADAGQTLPIRIEPYEPMVSDAPTGKQVAIAVQEFLKSEEDLATFFVAMREEDNNTIAAFSELCRQWFWVLGNDNTREAKKEKAVRFAKSIYDIIVDKPLSMTIKDE